MLGELLKKRVEGGNTLAVFYYRGRRRENGARLSLEVFRGNGHKLGHKKFKPAIKKFLFASRMVKHWKKLPINAVGFPCMDI